MKTSIQNVERNRKQVICPNSSWLGSSSVKLRYLDFFVYVGKDNNKHFARCHGQVKRPYTDKWFILAQVPGTRHLMTMERWVRPEDVTETVPARVVDPTLIEYFETMEKKWNS